MITHGLRVLVVDDDLHDHFFSQLALEKVLPGGSTVQVVNSGNQGIAYMIGEGKYSDRASYPFPFPRLMFSNSAHEDDVRTAFMLGASAYHIKPTGKAQLEQRMRSIVEYWAGSEVPPVDHMGRILETNSAGRLGARYAKPADGGPEMRRP